MAKIRRSFTAEFKAQAVLEAISGVKSSAEICRQHNIKPQLLSQWKRHFLEHASSLFESSQRHSDEHARIEELERVLGQKTLEVEILKKASSILQSHLDRSGRS